MTDPHAGASAGNRGRHWRLEVAAALLAAAIGGAPTLWAQGRGRGPQEPAARAVSVTFTAGDREILVRYFAAHRVRAKPLPPGIAKNLARGKPLPPGIAKRALPADLVAQLPRRPGFEIVIVGDRVVLLRAGGVVADILEGVFR